MRAIYSNKHVKRLTCNTGIRGRINSLLCHATIALKSSSACDDLNMGSDHRAVHACLPVMEYSNVAG